MRWDSRRGRVCRPPRDALAFRRDLVAATLLFAAASYYLGRSHPNNICNLMPFIALVALRSLDGESPAILPGLPRLTIAGMAIVVAGLTLPPWIYVPFRDGFSISSDSVASAAESVDDAAANLRETFSIPNQVGVADLRGLRGSYPAEMNVITPLDPGSL